MKWLVPRYPKKPGTLITLGSILAKPDDPETRLNKILPGDSDEVKKLAEVDPQHVKDESMAVRRGIQSDLFSKKSTLIKAMAPTVLGPGVCVEGKLVRGVQTTVEALQVVAKVFQPPQQQLDLHMKAAVAHPGVQYFMKKHNFSKMLYLVVGVATATKLSVRESRPGDYNALAGAGIDAGPVGTTKVEIALAGKHSTASEFEMEEECDFAYRLRAFTCHKYRASLATDRGDMVRGTLFGQRGDDDESGEESEDEEETFIAKFNAFIGDGDFSGGPEMVLVVC